LSGQAFSGPVLSDQALVSQSKLDYCAEAIAVAPSRLGFGSAASPDKTQCDHLTMRIDTTPIGKLVADLIPVKLQQRRIVVDERQILPAISIKIENGKAATVADMI